jgi:hypothetical protein
MIDVPRDVTWVIRMNKGKAIARYRSMICPACEQVIQIRKRHEHAMVCVGKPPADGPTYTGVVRLTRPKTELRRRAQPNPKAESKTRVRRILALSTQCEVFAASGAKKKARMKAGLISIVACG